MKSGSSAINIKLQYFPHFEAVVHVLQRSRGGSPTSGSCCYSGPSSSVSEMGRAYSKKGVHLPPPWGERKRRIWKERNPCCLPTSRFSPPHLGLGYPPLTMRPPLAGVRLIYLYPKACAKGPEATVGPQHVQPLTKGWTKQFRHLNLALGGNRGKGRNGWGGKSQPTAPLPSASQVRAHFMPPAHNPEVNIMQERSQQWLFTHSLKR